MYRGVIDGATYCVAVPKEGDSQCLLIHCHGFRPDGTPLYADIDDSFWIRLIQQQWTVAVTSYRRSGLIVADAIRDVFNLRNWISLEIGIPAWCFLDGRSMGGAIATRIAELPNAKRLFNGVLAIGAALMVKEDQAKPLSYRPTIPIVYLNNTSEHGPIEAYRKSVIENAERERQSAVSGGDEIITPALHSIHREGHNWTNTNERFRAFSSLVEWAFVGSLVSEFQFDGTRPAMTVPPKQATLVTQADTNTQVVEATVVQIEDKTQFNLDVIDLFFCSNYRFKEKDFFF